MDTIAPKPKPQNDNEPKRRPWRKHVQSAAYVLVGGKDFEGDPHLGNVAEVLRALEHDDPELTRKLAKVVSNHFELQIDRPARLEILRRWRDRFDAWNPRSGKPEDKPEAVARAFGVDALRLLGHPDPVRELSDSYKDRSGKLHANRRTLRTVEKLREELLNAYRHRPEGLEMKRRQSVGRACLSAGLRVFVHAKTVDRMLDSRQLGAPRKSGRGGSSG